MKKLFLLLIALCTLTVAQAQVVSSYTMQATLGTYTEITDGTVMDLTGLDLTADEVLTGKAWYPSGIVSEETTAAGFPIGFDFIFNDITCNQFIIGAHGFIALGKDEITIDPSHNQYIVAREEGADNIIGFMPNVDIYAHETSEFSYKVIGEAPYRTLVVQFKDWAPCFGWSADDVIHMNMQLRLNETSNTIEFVLGDAISEEDTEKMTRIAIRGYYRDILSLKETNDEYAEDVDMIDWVTTPEDYSVYLSAGMITSGLTYTFTPPAECEKPLSHFHFKGLNPRTSSFSLYWDWDDMSDADHVLLLITPSASLTQNPVDGEFYAAGDSLGGAYVLAYTTDTIYDSEEDYSLTLEPATQYYLHIYVANSFCSNGPKYDVGVLSSFWTKPKSPESIEITNTTTNTLTFNVEANDVDDEILVILTDSVRPNPPYAHEIEFGNPIGEYSIGEWVDGKGRVVYVGPSAQNVVVENLEEGTTYYLRAHSHNNNGYSTEVIETSDVTIARLPWTLDLSNTNIQEIPVGWTSVGSNKYLAAGNKKPGYGEEDIQFNVQIQPNTTNGHTVELTSPYIIIDKNNALFSLEYNMNTPGNWGMTGTKYDEWNEKDTLAIQVSSNGGEFENVTLINSTNNVKVDSINQFIPITADLSNYLNDTIQVRIYWSCYSNGKVRLTLEKWNIDEYIAPATPEIKVEDIAHTSAKVTWRSEQENYEVAYAKTGEEFTTIVVEGASEYVLTELEAETEYQVKVRGIVAEGEYSAWSEVVTFTTTEWPECDAPTNLAVQYVDQLVVLTWEGTEEHLSWELRYREANSTSWVTIDSIESTTWVIEDLPEEDLTYLWNVRAYCTAERMTAWSAQSSFTTGAAVPAAPVVTASSSNDTVHLVWNAVQGALYYKLYYNGQALTEPFEETAIDVQVVQAGTYCFTVTAINETGESEHSNEACATVVIDPEMEVPAAPVVEARIENDQAVLTWNAVEGATYYSIYFDGELLGSTQNLEARIKLPEPGEYCFIVAAGNLAGESNSEPVCVTYGEGIEELSVVLNIYPNPVKDKLYIETEANIEEINIYDAFGRLMTKVNGQTTTVDVSEYNAGVYIMKARSNNGETVKRFIKK